ncbi:unnamed protein product [Pleuronectes platessa]|uniref:Uncharacterized protein n=1 Tax=Pleuronectes platessa TaxID=8262 RepID=A0A9N7VML2_PLEPL|nr:unnamed protein product [Pleuronectes platessa]
MTRVQEPIHSHLVICRHFDLPQRSSISIRGGLLAGDEPVDVQVCVCVWSEVELPMYRNIPILFLLAVILLSKATPWLCCGSEASRREQPGLKPLTCRLMDDPLNLSS